MTPEQIKKNIEELRLLDSKKNEGNGALGWVFFKNRLTELALPLIEALQQSLSEAQADARVFSGSYNALAEDFGRLKEENERLRDLLKDACTDLGRMTLLRDKFYCEMETAQTETVFAKKEIERLRAGIGRAANVIAEAFSEDFSVHDLQNVIERIDKELEALHDA